MTIQKSFNYQFASGGYGDPLNANTLFFYSGSELTEDSIVQYIINNYDSYFQLIIERF